MQKVHEPTKKSKTIMSTLKQMISQQVILDFFALSTSTIYCLKGLEGPQNFSNPLILTSNPDGLICGTPQTPPHVPRSLLCNPESWQKASCTINLNAWNKFAVFCSRLATEVLLKFALKYSFHESDITSVQKIKKEDKTREREKEREGRLARVQLVDLSHHLLLFFVQGKGNASVPHLS